MRYLQKDLKYHNMVKGQCKYLTLVMIHVSLYLLPLSSYLISKVFISITLTDEILAISFFG